MNTKSFEKKNVQELSLIFLFRSVGSDRLRKLSQNVNYSSIWSKLVNFATPLLHLLTVMKICMQNTTLTANNVQEMYIPDKLSIIMFMKKCLLMVK